MKRKLAVASLLMALVIGMSFSATAQVSGDDEENGSSNISVSVTSTTAIDVKPEELTYGSMDVGTQETVSDNDFTAVELENIGSEYIDQVWAGATGLDTNPFGTGNPENYDSGNFLQIKPNNASSKSSVRGNTSTYHFVNRYEFHNSWDGEEGEIPSYIFADPDDVDGGVSDTYVGRFRAGDQWFFYVIPVVDNDQCDGTSGDPNIVRIGDSPHSSDTFGTQDFTDSGSDYTEYNLTQISGSGITYGAVSDSPADETGVRLDLGDEYREYELLTVCDEGKTDVDDAQTIRTRYNVQAGDSDDLTSDAEDRAQFLLKADSANPENMLLPGESISIDTAVEVPQGVPEGTVEEGQMTVYVTSDNDAST